jgi:hypothetical protein
MIFLYALYVKRTTLVLDEGCMDAVRALAREQGRTLSDLVNDLLAEGIQRRRRGRPVPQQLRLPRYRMGAPRVNLADRDALESAMEG